MAMQAPQNEIDLEQHKALREMERRRYLVGIVNPTGIVQEVVCPPDKDGAANGLEHGRDVVRLIEGEVRLTAYGKSHGWTLLEERCREDGVPELYGRWRDTVIARMDGYVIDLPDGDMSAIYPPSVLEQRAAGGQASAKPMRFVPGRGLVRADMAPESEEDRKSRVARLAGEMGLGPMDSEPKKGKR